MEKRLFIDQISTGQKIQDFFLIQKKESSRARNGRPYLALTVLDRTGYMEARVWDNAEKWSKNFNKGEVVHLEGYSTEYNGKVQLKVDKINRVEATQVDWALFIPS